ncbi:hypothetical protein HK099_003074 [Clydaea vesicula]|uniref:Uncharacterized protein n=1 Tax=Clydaea vesicula TaxID=447962 RepID=A0AAD5XWF5_9FUNG|nr:hypothetical protein HK099_003074 [Clydaea vesicula]KAJ3383702.1 hypothetical protein HDU92_004009 [Lobulomyces angularis]
MRNYLNRFSPLQLLKLHISRQIPTSADALKSINSPTLLTSLSELLNEIHEKSFGNLAKNELQINFKLSKKESNIKKAGDGVFITGFRKKNSIVALYPGLIYDQANDPKFIPSLNNQYFLRCFDGIYCDGKYNGLSKLLYTSKYSRINDPLQTIKFGDRSWLKKEELLNFLNCGQFINNANQNFTSNVRYQELNVPPTFPMELRYLIPNLHYRENWIPFEDFTRVICLISTRDLKNEELFSTYNDVVVV